MNKGLETFIRSPPSSRNINLTGSIWIGSELLAPLGILFFQTFLRVANSFIYNKHRIHFTLKTKRNKLNWRNGLQQLVR